MEIHNVGPFILGKTLGAGTTGKVKLAFHKDSGFKAAIKIVNKEFLASRLSMLKKVEREITVMKLLDHPHVLRLYDVYETSKYLFLVLEHVEGGELFDYLVKKGRLEAQEALVIFQQIICGIEYCHKHYICHRDLKPENLLLDTDRNIKIADFGMASLMRKGNLLQTSCGSPHYASPEVVMGSKYSGESADVWSCGVILYALLTGKLPFDDDNIRRLLSKVKSGVFSMPQFLGKDIKELIWKMMTVDPSKRITIAEIKQNVWFRSNNSEILTQPILFVDEMKIEIPDQDSIDEEVIRSLISLGMAEEPEIRQALKQANPNIHQTFYKILLLRKLNPPNEPYKNQIKRPLSGLSNRSRGFSEPPPFIPIPMTPPPVLSQIPPGGFHNINNNNNNTTSPMMISPPTSPLIGTMHAHNGSSTISLTNPSSTASAHAALLGVNKRRNTANATGTTGTPSSSNGSSPINIINTSNRLQKMKLESPVSQSPIIGSSPKRSWLSNFFSKADKAQDGSNSSQGNVVMKEQTFGIYSKKPFPDVVSDVEKSLARFNIGFQFSSPQIIKAKFDGSEGPVTFNVEILNSSKEGTFLINFNHQSGSADDYTNMCEQIQDDLDN